MVQKFFRTVFHPLFIYAVIAALECIPYISDRDMKVYHELPKEGDNFKSSSEDMIYYYSGKGKYTYSSPECYFSLGNPSWGAAYKDGGIKTIDDALAASIPLLGDMCHNDHVPATEHRKQPTTIEKYSSVNYLLDNFSNISHVLWYVIWSLSLLVYYYNRSYLYWFVLAICFVGGGLLEFVQMFFIPGRNGSIEDQLLNCIGAIFGLLIFHFFKFSKLREYLAR